MKGRRRYRGDFSSKIRAKTFKEENPRTGGKYPLKAFSKSRIDDTLPGK